MSERKNRYKMYKAGKNWIFATVTLVACIVSVGFFSETVAADTNSVSSAMSSSTLSSKDPSVNEKVITSNSESSVNQNTSSQPAVTNYNSATSVATDMQQSTKETINRNSTTAMDNKKTTTATTEEQTDNPTNNESTLDSSTDKPKLFATEKSSTIAKSTLTNKKSQSQNPNLMTDSGEKTAKTQSIKQTQPVLVQLYQNGHWYLVDSATHKNQIGFQKIKEQNKVVYYATNGQMQYGQQHLNGNWYLFNGVTGARQTGFQYIGDQHKTVYYNNNGQMQYGQQHLNGCWYLFDNVTGAMKTGLYYIDYQHKVVYYAGNGQMQYGLRSINGTELYFNHTTGALEMNTNIANFFNSIATAAQQASRRYNLYPSLMMAQAALESGYGDSTLTKNAHNLFGVKYSGQGSYVTMPTIEYYNGHKYSVAAKFQAYSSYYDSLERYAQLIANSFYNSNRTHSANVATAAKNLYHGKYGSYATDPQYADKIINMINLYGLLAYDNSEF